jgi:hypothetical protein
LVNNRKRATVFSSESDWYVSDQEPPLKHNLITGIDFDECVTTENVAEMDSSRAKRRWRLLAPGRRLPKGVNTNTGVVYAEAIWLDTLLHSVDGHHSVINDFFIYALEIALGEFDGDPDKATYQGRKLDWSLFAEIGEEAGVDYRIDAWLSGVPLEYVLAE